MRLDPCVRLSGCQTPGGGWLGVRLCVRLCVASGGSARGSEACDMTRGCGPACSSACGSTPCVRLSGAIPQAVDGSARDSAATCRAARGSATRVAQRVADMRRRLGVQLHGQRVPHRRAHLALDCPRWRRPDGEVPEHYETCVWRAKRRTSNKHRRNVPVYSPVVLGATLAPLLSWRFCSGMTLSHTRAGVKRRWSATRARTGQHGSTVSLCSTWGSGPPGHGCYTTGQSAQRCFGTRDAGARDSG